MPELKIDPKFNIHSNYNKLNIVNPYRFNSGGAPNSHEPETIALMASIGWADDATISPHNGLTYAEVYNVLDSYFAAGKNDGWLPLMKAVYLFIGDNANSHKWNAVNPQDSDEAFRALFFGSGTNNSNGFTGNSFDSYVNTKFNQSIHSELNNESFGFYSRINNTDNDVDIGVNDTNNRSSISAKFGDGKNYCASQKNQVTGITQTSSLKLFAVSRNNSTNYLRQRGSSTVENVSNTSSGLANLEFYFGAWNLNGSPSNNSIRQFSYVFIGSGMDEPKMISHYNAVQQLQTDLGRQV